MQIQRKNRVTETPTRPPQEARAHFAAKLAHETDCADVRAGLALDEPGFVLVDVRSRDAFDRGHVPGAVHIPLATLTEERLAQYPADLLFVVYCAGPHCNASTRAAGRLAGLGRPVKEMIGGTTGWLDEGFALATATSAAVSPGSTPRT